ncbi:MAG: hypothetical protein K2M01_04935 [Paramuribaculum sp.]|nr:hypothetical protein [Paramuribaculum sp.]
MAHKAILRLQTATGINEYEILQLNYEFTQNLSLGPVHGIPPMRWGHLTAFSSGNVTGGVIKLTLATLPNSDTIFHRWMFSRWRPMNGTITVEMNSRNNVADKLTITFQAGFCTKLTDSFNSQTGGVMTTTIDITCEQITVGTNIPAVWPAFL